VTNHKSLYAARLPEYQLSQNFHLAFSIYILKTIAYG